MGFFSRLKNAKDVSAGRPTMLSLVAPTRLRLPLEVGKDPALTVFVLDPSLWRGDGWDEVLRIVDEAASVDPVPVEDPTAISEPLLDQIADDSFFGPMKKLVTDDFVIEWMSAGQQIAEAEARLGLATRERQLRSTTSAALTRASLQLEEPALVLLAQVLARDSYAFDRARRHGPQSVEFTATSYPAEDFRLLLARRPSSDPVAWDLIQGWTQRMPMQSQERTAWFNAIATASADNESRYVTTVLEATRAVVAVGDGLRGRAGPN